jgi:hypothetical protein
MGGGGGAPAAGRVFVQQDCWLRVCVGGLGLGPQQPPGDPNGRARPKRIPFPSPLLTPPLLLTPLARPPRWSLGMVLYEMMVDPLCHPFAADDSQLSSGPAEGEAERTLAAICDGRLHLPEGLPEQWEQLLRSVRACACSARVDGMRGSGGMWDSPGPVAACLPPSPHDHPCHRPPHACTPPPTPARAAGACWRWALLSAGATTMSC